MVRHISILGLVAAGCALVLSDADRIATPAQPGCCASVDFRYEPKVNGEYHLMFNNHSGRQIVAYTFERGSRQDGTLLFGAPIPEGYYEETLRLTPQSGALRLVSVVFDDGSFEGDAKASGWNLVALKAAQDESAKRVPMLREYIQGRISQDNARAEIGDVPNATITHNLTREEMAANMGRADVRGFHRDFIESGHKSAGEVDQLEARYNLLKGRR